MYDILSHRMGSQLALHWKSVVMTCHCFCAKYNRVSQWQLMEQQDIMLFWGSTKCHKRMTQVSWMSHDPPKKHTSTWMVTLTCKMPNYGPHRIQGLPRPTHSIWRAWQYGANSEYSALYSMKVVTSGVYLSLLCNEFVPFLMKRGMTMNSAWFQ